MFCSNKLKRRLGVYFSISFCSSTRVSHRSNWDPFADFHLFIFPQSNVAGGGVEITVEMLFKSLFKLYLYYFKMYAAHSPVLGKGGTKNYEINNNLFIFSPKGIQSNLHHFPVLRFILITALCEVWMAYCSMAEWIRLLGLWVGATTSAGTIHRLFTDGAWNKTYPIHEPAL